MAGSAKKPLSSAAVDELEAEDAEMAAEIAANEAQVARLSIRNMQLKELRRAVRTLLGAENSPGGAAAPPSPTLRDRLEGRNLGQAIEAAMADMVGPAWPRDVAAALAAAGFEPSGKSTLANLVNAEMSRLSRLRRLLKTDHGYLLPEAVAQHC